MTLPPDFIDRDEEIALFQKVLAGELDYSILAFVINPERGKTYLMNYFRGYCIDNDIPVSLINFDSRQGSLRIGNL